MEQTIYNIVAAISPGIITGIVLAIWNRKQKKHDEEKTNKELTKHKAELLRIDLLMATAMLSYAIAMAIKRGEPNGEVEEGIAEYNKAMRNFKEFERDLVAEHTIE